MRESRITSAQFNELLRTELAVDTNLLFADRMGHGSCRACLRYNPAHLRPGGTLSGPSMMTLADTALYGAALSVVGMVPLAVTTDLHFHFMRKPAAVDLWCDARVLKAGRRLVVGEFHLRSEGSTDVVCAGQGSYSVPPSKSGTTT